MKIWFLENSQKNVRFPYFREDGGGQERYKNFPIFYFLIRGRREGVQVNKDNFFIYALFFIDGFPNPFLKQQPEAPRGCNFGACLYAYFFNLRYFFIIDKSAQNY